MLRPLLQLRGVNATVGILRRKEFKAGSWRLINSGNLEMQGLQRGLCCRAQLSATLEQQVLRGNFIHVGFSVCWGNTQANQESDTVQLVIS